MKLAANDGLAIMNTPIAQTKIFNTSCKPQRGTTFLSTTEITAAHAPDTIMYNEMNTAIAVNAAKG